MQPNTSNTTKSKEHADKTVTDVIKLSASLVAAPPQPNPSLTDLVIATKRRRTGKPPSSDATPDYADLYGEDEEASPQSAPIRTPATLRSIVGGGAVNAPPQQKPRPSRRCSITKFSLQRTAQVAVRQLQREHFARRSRTGLKYRDIVPILDQAMADIDASCF